MLCLRKTNLRRKTRLKVFFNDILDNVSIDYGNPEICDIKKSVREFLNRMTERINKRGIFTISRIEPCGSMAERTSLWKIGDQNLLPGEKSKTNVTVEFDFLAVLEKPLCKVEKSCSICMKVLDPIVHTNRFHEDNDWLKIKDGYASNPEIVDTAFRKELFLGIISACNCCSLVENASLPGTAHHDYRFEPTSSDLQGGCDKCSIETKMESCRLRVVLLLKRAPWFFCGPVTISPCLRLTRRI